MTLKYSEISLLVSVEASMDCFPIKRSNVMGHILTPEFLNAFDGWRDNENPLVHKKLIHLNSLETWLLFSCNSKGTAYGYVFDEECNKSQSINLLELEARLSVYFTCNKRMIKIPVVIVDSGFTPKLLSEAKTEFYQEKDFALDERQQTFFDLIQNLRG